MKVVFVIFLSMLGFAAEIKAQSAVYFCSVTGAYGYCFNAETVMKARETAYKNCIDNGGVTPVVLVSTEDSGFGSICIGTSADGSIVIGVALAKSSADEADEAARFQCESSGAVKHRIEKRWEDK